MTEVKSIPIIQITVAHNDRTTFDPTALQALADSIRQHGLVNPVTVRHLALDRFELVAGERRLRAVKSLGWETIPSTILPEGTTSEQAATLMLSENVARSDLDPVDEAAAYKLRIDKYGWTIEDCAKKAGVSINRVRNRLSLLALRTDLQDLVRTGNLELGYARMIGASGLDTNFQTIAFRALRDNPNPSLAWFKRILGDQVQKMRTTSLMDDPLFSGRPQEAPTAAPRPELPPTPATCRPPVKDIPAHIEFWRKAAAEWDALGKNFKRDEALAAAAALTYVL